MLRTVTMLVLMCGLIIVAGCDDGPAVDPDLTGVVVDESGEPVAFVAVGIVYRLEGSPLPGDWDKTYPDKPQTQIHWEFPEPFLGRFEILSYDRELVRVLIDNDTPAVFGQIYWNTTDDSGQPVPSGWYYTVSKPDNEPTMESDFFLYYYLPSDIHRARHATTDDQGQFRISRDLLPLGEMHEVTNDVGEVIGSYAISREFKVMAVLDRGGALSSTSSIVTLDEGEAGVHVELILP